MTHLWILKDNLNHTAAFSTQTNRLVVPSKVLQIFRHPKDGYLNLGNDDFLFVSWRKEEQSE